MNPVHSAYNEDQLRELELWPLIQLQQAPNPSMHHDMVPQTAENDAPDTAPMRNAPRVPIKAERQPQTRPAAVPAVATSLPPNPERIAHIATLDWDGLTIEAAACGACKLCKQRKQAVLGVGAQNAPWLFVGEGPGAEEDDQGEPFVGPAGKLLDAMLAAAGLQRGREVYIANVVKCRPPGNRNPSVDEALACAPLLDRQIDLIQPKIIVALGKIALNRLTGSDASMASMRGKLHAYRGIRVVATYHPAYLLRSLPDKLKAWEDLMLAKKAMAASQEFARG